jgi:hypothetical protein
LRQSLHAEIESLQLQLESLHVELESLPLDGESLSQADALSAPPPQLATGPVHRGLASPLHKGASVNENAEDAT